MCVGETNAELFYVLSFLALVVEMLFSESKLLWFANTMTNRRTKTKFAGLILLHSQ